ncbi:MAG: hypothetical protein ACJ8HI_16715 [Massilia sp.]
MLTSSTYTTPCAKVRARLHWRVIKRCAAVACWLLIPAAGAQAQDRPVRCVDIAGRASAALACANDAGGRTAKTPARSTSPEALAVRPPGSARAPLPVRPDATADIRQWGRGADVMVVSRYEVQPLTQVTIAHTAKPVLLVLTSYHATRWVVLPSAGTRLRAVVVASHDESRIDVQAPPGVPVLVDKLPDARKSDSLEFRALISKLNARYGVESVLRFKGSYAQQSDITLTGPFVSNPNLTLEGLRVEVPRLRFSFDLISLDGRKLPYTNTGPIKGNRYTGIVRGESLAFRRGGPAAVSDDGREAYYLEGNGSKLVWAHDGKTETVAVPPNMPPLSWVSGLAWDTRKAILVLVSFGGEGFLYRYDTNKHTWLDSHSLQNRDMVSVAVNQKTGDFLAVSDAAELVRFNALGELQEILSLQNVLAELHSTLEGGSGRLKNIVVAADGEGVALVNVREGSVTHIWTYDQQTRKAQLTYKAMN